MNARRPRLVIMTKVPKPGAVKTRLGKGVGMGPAARWFRRQSLSLIRRLSADPRWKTILAVAPDREGLEARVWPPHILRIPQGPGDLGDRMGRILRSLPPGPVVIIGADIAGVARADIAAAFHALGRADAVFGPAEDGGYWLIGLARGRRSAPAGLFSNVRWSTAHALADTEASLGDIRIAHVRTLQDVDTVEDLRPNVVW